jgi:polyamine oxidase
MRSLPTVLVIGAGIAGLAAAGYLQRAGHQVRVLEARNEIGGRTRASTELGLPLDLGASWLHGAQGHPLFDQVLARGLIWAATDYDNFAAFHEDGRSVTAQLNDMDTYEKALYKLGRKAKAKHSIADRLGQVPADVAARLTEVSRQFVIATALEE